METAVLISFIIPIAEINNVPGIAKDFPCTAYSLYKLSLPEIKGVPKRGQYHNSRKPPELNLPACPAYQDCPSKNYLKSPLLQRAAHRDDLAQSFVNTRAAIQ